MEKILPDKNICDRTKIPQTRRDSLNGLIGKATVRLNKIKKTHGERFNGCEEARKKREDLNKTFAEKFKSEKEDIQQEDDIFAKKTQLLRAKKAQQINRGVSKEAEVKADGIRTNFTESSNKSDSKKLPPVPNNKNKDKDKDKPRERD